MSFTLNSHTPIRGRLRHLVRRQLRHAEKCLREDGASAVHGARTAVKKVRSIGRLLHQAGHAMPDKDERRLLAAGRGLSAIRDSDAVIETFDRLCHRFPGGLPAKARGLIRRQLVLARTDIAAKAAADVRYERSARALRATRRSAAGWTLPKLEPRDLPDLLKASYRAGRQAMNLALETTVGSDLHRWRKRVKVLWYQARLIESVAPHLHVEITRLEQLESWLGEYHNLSVLSGAVANDRVVRRREPAALRALTAMSRTLQDTLRRKAFAHGRLLFADRPRAFGLRLRRALSAQPDTSAAGRRKPLPVAA